MTDGQNVSFFGEAFPRTGDATINIAALVLNCSDVCKLAWESSNVDLSGEYSLCEKIARDTPRCQPLGCHVFLHS